MKKTINPATKNLATGALIAALYIGLTFLSNIFNLAYGPVQFRISEALTVLPVFTPAAIWGLTIGCLISNIFSFNLIDMLLGTLATLLAALAGYALRNVKWFKLPLLSMLMPVIFNALIVGAEITFFFVDKATVPVFFSSALSVGLGELVVCVGLGTLLYTAVNKNAGLRVLIE